MMNCKQATELISQGQDRDLSKKERLGLHIHLLICRGCKNYNRHLQFIRKAMQRMRDR